MNAAPPSRPVRPFGFVEWFRPGEYERTEEVLPDLLSSGASYLRTHLSWAEYLTPGGEAWYDWLIPKLGRRTDVLPCIHYTPPSMSRTGQSTGAPRVLKDYADFIDHVLTRYGEHFRYIELWNEPNNLLDWDWRQDVDFRLFCEMVGGAAYWANRRGWRPVLGGPCPFDAHWIDLMGERELLDHVHAVGLHGFPGTWDSESGSWLGWDHYVEETRQIVDRYNPAAEIWITETGYSTWRQDEAQQARRFLGALAAPVQRMYWYSWRDVPSEVAVQEGHWFDPRHYYLGAVDQANRPKLLARLLMDGGVPRVRMVTKLGAPSLARRVRTIAITGGSGFIGCNLANSYLRDGEDVVIIDNLSRNGVEQNLNWMRDQYGSRVHAVLADIRDPAGFEDAIADAKAVVHLAAQTAVTSSLDDPLHDFEVNARGSINVLEAVRRSGRDIPVLFSSTNKVYGGLEELEMMELGDRYIPADEALRSHGIGEDQKLDLCTPYGCSKGVADQYVLDYAKHFGVRSSVLRMSCIYGPHQFGTEDQGWVAHFLLKALRGEPISVYGDGKQVRDVLHVDDAVAAYRALLTATDRVSGQAFNLGGGPHNAVSINAVLRQIDRLLGQRTPFTYGDWRQGDQLYFVADTRKLSTTVGWRARISWREGLADLCNWLARHRIQRSAIRRAIA